MTRVSALALLSVAGIALGCSASGEQTQPPILGVVWGPAQKGYGQVEPTTVFNGGDPTGLVEHVHWQGWGKPSAIGTGKGWVPPDKAPYSDFRHQTVQLVASDLGRCRGKLAYRRIQWLFATSRKYEHRMGHDICTGDSVSASTPLIE